MYRSAWIAGVLAWLAVVGGAAHLLGRHDADPRLAPVPALRFAGSDVVYVLRRVAAEAGLILALDELRPLGSSEDLRLLHVDVDLPAGTVESALETLGEKVGGFEYALDDGLLYVRSYRLQRSDAPLDRKNLPGGTFEGDLGGLARWLLKVQPGALLRVHLARGHPVGPEVKLRVPAGSSALDVLLLYAKESGVGWRLRRAGQRVSQSEEEIVVVATEVTPWKPLDSPHHVPPLRTHGSMIQALADLAVRTETPVCVIDPAPLYGNRGTLDRVLAIDPGVGLEPSLRDLAQQARDVFRWEKSGDLYVVWAEGFDRFPWLGDILNEPVEAGRFTGTLSELARWLDAHRAEPSDRQLVGGEIASGDPAATIEIEGGSTVGDVLFAFARTTGRGWYLVVFDRLNPEEPTEDWPWRGAFLSDLPEWAELATPY